MGEAKRRGTVEQRTAAAVERTRLQMQAAIEAENSRRQKFNDSVMQAIEKLKQEQPENAEKLDGLGREIINRRGKSVAASLAALAAGVMAMDPKVVSG